MRNTIVFCILIEFQNVLFMNYVTLKSNVICYLCFCIHDRDRILNIRDSLEEKMQHHDLKIAQRETTTFSIYKITVKSYISFAD